MDSFEWGRVLGKGAFGTVRIARRRDDGVEFAVKLIDAARLGDRRQLLDREIGILNKLTESPFTVKLQFLKEDDANGMLMLGFEVLGGTLHDLVMDSRAEGLSSDAVVFYASELVAGVEHLHRSSIAHLDLHPRNVLMTSTRHIKITDFGLAAEFGTRLIAFEAAGVTHFTPPEYVNVDDQRHGAGQGDGDGAGDHDLENLGTTVIVDGGADIWALGCILYFMHYKRSPFQLEDGDPTSITNKHPLNAAVRAKRLEYSFPTSAAVSPAAKDLITRILVHKAARIGIADVKASGLFRDVFGWNRLHLRDAPVVIRGRRASLF